MARGLEKTKLVQNTKDKKKGNMQDCVFKFLKCDSGLDCAAFTHISFIVPVATMGQDFDYAFEIFFTQGSKGCAI